MLAATRAAPALPNTVFFIGLLMGQQHGKERPTPPSVRNVRAAAPVEVGAVLFFVCVCSSVAHISVVVAAGQQHPLGKPANGSVGAGQQQAVNTQSARCS